MKVTAGDWVVQQREIFFMWMDPVTIAGDGR